MKLLAVLLLAFLIKIFVPTNATEMPPKWTKLMALVEEEISTIKSANLNNAGLKYRLFELYSERIKLLREKENKTFLNEAPALREKHGKAFYFRNSKKEYLKARKYGLSLIKYYPKYQHVADIYYTLALNSRDYAKDKLTERYLLLSLKKARKNAAIVHHAKTSLAEHYYNKKRYWKALKYYRDVLKRTTDEWHSKNLLNSAWCYLKVKNHKRALKNIRSAYDYSIQKKYIDVKDQVLNSIGLFYVQADQIREGIDFYKRYTKAPASYLMKMAQFTTDEGSLTKTRSILTAALQHAKRHKNLNDELIIYKAELDIYREYHRHDLYYRSANNIESLNKKMKFSDEDREEIVQKVSEFVGFLQIKLSKNKKIKNKKYNPKLLQKVVRYFEILSSIDPVNNRKYSFYTGESYFSVRKYLRAANSYKTALEQSKVNKVKDEKLDAKILNSLLGVIAVNGLAKKTQNEFKIYTYSNYLKLWPVDDKAQKLYQKLFNLYVELKRPTDSVKVVDTYHKHYPQDIKIHRNMINKVMDYHIKRKDTDKFAAWIKKLETGYMAFDEKYIKKATLVLGQILFDRFQKFDNQGKKTVAATGYISLFENDLYPRKIKAESAYNASILFLELGQIATSFDWFNKSLEKFKQEELFKLKSKTLALSNHYALVQDFPKAIHVSEKMLERFCEDKYPEKVDFFQNTVSYQILEENYVAAYNNLQESDKCAIPKKVSEPLGQTILAQIYENRDYKNLFTMLTMIRKKDQSLDNTLARMIIDTHWDTLTNSDDSNFQKANKLLAHMYDNKHEYQLSASLHDEIDEIHLFKTYQKDILTFIKSEVKLPEPFKGEEFNLVLEDHMMQLKDLNDRADQFIKKGYVEITLRVYQKLISLYSSFGQKIKSLTPKNQPKEFVSAFRGEMSKLSQRFYIKAADYKKTASNLIKKNQLYTSLNKEFKNGRPMNAVIPTRYPASFFVVPMDTYQGKKL